MDDKIQSKSINDIKDFIINSCHKNLYHEVCGFIGFDEQSKMYIATLEKNISPNPASFFAISPASYLKFKNEHSMVGIFHSHIAGDENPSEFDIKMAEANCLAFVIFSTNTKKFHIYEPKNTDYNVNILQRIKDKFT